MDKNGFLDEISGKYLNFLIGSGASAGVVPTIWISSISKSFEQLLTSDDYSEEQKNVLYYLWFNLWISKTKVFSNTDKSDSVVNEYLKFVDSLVRIINNEGFDKHKRANIFTTNYDSLFELAFDIHSKKNRLTYFNDGSRGFITKFVSTEDFYINVNHSGVSDNFQRSIPTINLIKLHGSITWIKNDNRIEMSLNNKTYEKLCLKAKEINSELKTLSERNARYKRLADFFSLENLEKSIFENDLSEVKLQKFINSINRIFGEKFKEFKRDFNELPIVNPTKRKFSETVFEQHYYQMLRLLSYELERKNCVLLVFGFSFADEHILEIVRRSLVNPFLKIYVVAYNEKSMVDIKEALGHEARIEFLPNFNVFEPGSCLKGDFAFFNSLFRGDK